MGKKNLDELFQEKLKDFQEAPDNKVWQSIEASLDKKKKSRKVIPIWWKLGGVAAILIAGLFIWNPFVNDPGNVPTITDVDTNAEQSSKENNTQQISNTQSSGEERVVDTNTEKSTPKEKNDAISLDQITNAEAVNDDETSKSDTTEETLKSTSGRNQKATNVQMAEANTSDNLKGVNKNQVDTKVSESNFDSITKESAVAKSDILKDRSEENSPETNYDFKRSEITNNEANSVKEGIAQIGEETAKDSEEGSKKKSIFDEIAEQEREKEIVAESTGGKWSAGPSVAPVYYNAIGEGSPVHSIFVPNSKSGDVNLSYGLSVAYEVSKKLSIRSGVHKVDYGYRTNDVEFTSSLENASAGQIDNIDYTLTARNLLVNSKINTRVEALNQNPFINETSADVSATSPARDGVMQQQFAYLEVPVELNYALLDRKFGINLIGGVSSLFLVDNSISLTSGDLTTEMGEANNVNAVNFSTNVGFGINYKFTQKVRLNIEPVFKYQLNTFSETDGTFNPFSVGVYSGLSFKF